MLEKIQVEVAANPARAGPAAKGAQTSKAWWAKGLSLHITFYHLETSCPLESINIAISDSLLFQMFDQKAQLNPPCRASLAIAQIRNT